MTIKMYHGLVRAGQFLIPHMNNDNINQCIGHEAQNIRFKTRKHVR